jgi:hypothetical protein
VCHQPFESTVGIFVVAELCLLVLLFSPVFIDRHGKAQAAVEYIRNPSSQTTAATAGPFPSESHEPKGVCQLSCRRQGVNPFDYLKDLFTQLPSAKITEIKQFTPHAWASAKTKEKLIALAP